MPSRIMWRAARSLTEPPGLLASSLPYSSRPGTSRSSLRQAHERRPSDRCQQSGIHHAFGHRATIPGWPSTSGGRADTSPGSILRCTRSCKVSGPAGSTPGWRPTPFQALLRAIVAQQVSAKAARTVYARLCELAPGRRPDGRVAAGARRRHACAPPASARPRRATSAIWPNTWSTAGSTWRRWPPQDDAAVDPGAHRRARHRHLDGRGLPHLPAAAAGRLPGRRPGAAHGDPAALPQADPADARRRRAASPSGGGPTGRSRAGICGAASSPDAAAASRAVAVSSPT